MLWVLPIMLTGLLQCNDQLFYNNADWNIPTGPSQPKTVGNYVWARCRTEVTGKRALSDASFASDTINESLD